MLVLSLKNMFAFQNCYSPSGSRIPMPVIFPDLQIYIPRSWNLKLGHSGQYYQIL